MPRRVQYPKYYRNYGVQEAPDDPVMAASVGVYPWNAYAETVCPRDMQPCVHPASLGTLAMDGSVLGWNQPLTRHILRSQHAPRSN